MWTCHCMVSSSIHLHLATLKKNKNNLCHHYSVQARLYLQKRHSDCSPLLQWQAYRRCASPRWHFHLALSEWTRNVKTWKRTWAKLIIVCVRAGRECVWLGNGRQERGLTRRRERSLYLHDNKMLSAVRDLLASRLAAADATKVSVLNNGRCNREIRPCVYEVTSPLWSFERREKYADQLWWAGSWGR